MAGKIGYFLFALLVLTTGTLCRQQLPVQYASGGDSVGSLFRLRKRAACTISTIRSSRPKP